MRGVNIHVDFVMIQCTKNKNLTPLSSPLCHPAIRRGSVNFLYYTPGSATAWLYRGLPYAASPYGEALKFRSPTARVFALQASPRYAPSAR